MGIVQRQGLKYSLINFAGLAVSLVATIWLYPRVQSEYGLLGFLTATAMLFLPFVSLGVNQVSVRFFPRFVEKERQHNGFLRLLLGWVAMGFCVFMLLVFLCKPLIVNLLQSREPLLRDHIWLVLPLLFFQLFATILGQYTINFGRAAVPTLFNDFLIKLIVPAGLFGVWRGWWTVETAIMGLVVNYFLACTGLVFYLKRIGEWHFDRRFLKIERPLLREIAGFAGFGMALNLAMFLITRLDLLMVSWFLGLQKGGIYTIASYISNVMDVPARAIITVAMPLIAKYWLHDKRLEINGLYQKSSINLLIIGIAFYGVTLVSLDSLIALMPNSGEMQAGRAVVAILGAAKLFDLATGLNGYILNLSKHHWLLLWSLVVLAGAGVALNLWLVPQMGMTGAALATLGGMTAYNLTNSVLVYLKFGMQPFSRNTFFVLLAGAITGLAVWWLPAFNSLIINILWKSGSFLGLFLTAVLWGNLSPDMNDFWAKIRSGKLW